MLFSGFPGKISVFLPFFVIFTENKLDPERRTGFGFAPELSYLCVQITMNPLMTTKQQTLKAPITFSGKGLHTGVQVTMTVNPAEAGTGIVFRRTDIEGQPLIPALCDYVVDTSRGTTIEVGGHRVSTIEHVMSALWTLGVDNALIDIDAEIDFKDITPKFFSDLKKFNPFGPENTKPVFCTHNVYDYGTSKVVGRDQEHIKLELVDNKSNNVMNGIAFGQSSHVRYIKTKRSFDICYTIEENTHKRGEVQLQIEDIKPN